MATLDIIKDPVTGKSYSRDTSIAGSTYAPYTAPAIQPAPVIAPTKTPTVQSIQSGLNDLLKGLGGALNTQTGQVNITADQLTAATQPKPIDLSGATPTIPKIDPGVIATGAGSDTANLQKYIDLFTPKETP